jgi:hypothetical protein
MIAPTSRPERLRCGNDSSLSDAPERDSDAAAARALACAGELGPSHANSNLRLRLRLTRNSMRVGAYGATVTMLPVHPA